MDDRQLIAETAAYARRRLEKEGSGHDWWHTYRVHKTAQEIGMQENANMLVVELGALLHDIADWKFYDENAGALVTQSWLTSQGVERATIKQVTDIVSNISFKGEQEVPAELSLEGKVVQDADRIDALGAIGIARVFAYGGFSRREIYNPDIKPVRGMDAEAYKRNNNTSLNHFYEKLFLIGQRMNTEAGRRIAVGRTEYMQKFVHKFMEEWNGRS